MIQTGIYPVFRTLTITRSYTKPKEKPKGQGRADYLVDTQTVFINPAYINLLAPYITFEMGAIGAGAEGGFSRKLANGNMIAAYVGHDNTKHLRDGTVLIKQRNPVEITYDLGHMAFAGSVSTTNDKKNGKKVSTLVVKKAQFFELIFFKILTLKFNFKFLQLCLCFLIKLRKT